MSIDGIHNNPLKTEMYVKKTQVHEENKSEKNNFIYQKQEERVYKDKIMVLQSELRCKYQKTLDREVNESLELYSMRLETLLNLCEEQAKTKKLKESEEQVYQAKIEQQQLELHNKYGQHLDRATGESLEKYSTRLEILLNLCEEQAKVSEKNTEPKFEPKFGL